MIEVSDYDPRFMESLSKAYELLRSAGLTVHTGVSRITLHGTRGPAGGYRPDSDIDLALHVRPQDVPDSQELGDYLKRVLLTSLDAWVGPIELDAAVLFDRSGCGLVCLGRSGWDDDFCETDGVDCIGIYKIQKGFDGFVTGPASQVQLMYPFITIWRRE